MRKSVNAYAKINLFLDITALRDDGYHDIQSVMQSVSLCDVVDIEVADSFEAFDKNKIIIECDDPRIPCGEKNIAFKAAELFLSQYRRTCELRISIKKSIPMAAGLAGGSADAAAVLVGLNELFEFPFSVNELCAMGRKIGADVPFCIKCGCSYLKGIGDVFFDFPRVPENTVFVIAYGGEGVSTKEAYALLDEKYDNFKNYAPKDVQLLKNCIEAAYKDGFGDAFFNIFEEPILKIRPTVGLLENIMLSSGAETSMMSGSGPSVFGVFFSLEEARDAVEKIKRAGHFATVAYPVGKRSFLK